VNFGKVSGVIVDVCRDHGTWFDGGELTRVVAFAAGGGLARTRAQQKKESAKASAAVHLLASVQTRSPMEGRLDEWRFFLRELFFW
jgi:Zn-finger nucleic acid-binding protein